jgi:hypothetical protein
MGRRGGESNPALEVGGRLGGRRLVGSGRRRLLALRRRPAGAGLARIARARLLGRLTTSGCRLAPLLLGLATTAGVACCDVGSKLPKPSDSRASEYPAADRSTAAGAAAGPTAVGADHQRLPAAAGPTAVGAGHHRAAVRPIAGAALQQRAGPTGQRLAAAVRPIAGAGPHRLVVGLAKGWRIYSSI